MEDKFIVTEGKIMELILNELPLKLRWIRHTDLKWLQTESQYRQATEPEFDWWTETNNCNACVLIVDVATGSGHELLSHKATMYAEEFQRQFD